MNASVVAAKLGVEADQLGTTLDQLWADVAGDQDIPDGHVRFFQHISLMAFAADTWPDLDALINEARTSTDTNAAARVALRRMVRGISWGV